MDRLQITTMLAPNATELKILRYHIDTFMAHFDKAIQEHDIISLVMNLLDKTQPLFYDLIDDKNNGIADLLVTQNTTTVSSLTSGSFVLGGTLLQMLVQDQRSDQLWAEFIAGVYPILNERIRELIQFFLSEYNEDTEKLMFIVRGVLNKFFKTYFGVLVGDQMPDMLVEVITNLMKIDSSMFDQVSHAFREWPPSNLTGRAVPDCIYSATEMFKQIGIDMEKKCRGAEGREATHSVPTSLLHFIQNSRAAFRNLVLEGQQRTVQDSHQRTLDSLLQTRMREEDWLGAAELLSQGVSHELFRSVIKEFYNAPVNSLIFLEIAGYWDTLFPNHDFTVKQFVNQERWSLLMRLLSYRRVSKDLWTKAITEAINKAADIFIKQIIPDHCCEDQVDGILEQLVGKKRWDLVDHVLSKSKYVTNPQRKWVVEKACGEAEEHIITKYILHYSVDDQLHSILKQVEDRNLKEATSIVLQKIVSKFLSKLASKAEFDDEDCTICLHAIEMRIHLLHKISKQPLEVSVESLNRSREWDGIICKLLSVSFVQFICIQSTNSSALEESSLQDSNQLLQDVMEDVVLWGISQSGIERQKLCSEDAMRQKVSNWKLKLVEALGVPCLATSCELLQFCKFFLWYFAHRRELRDDFAIVAILSTIPLLPTVQNVALRIMLAEGRWDVISVACLSHVWETVRRELFEAAVKQKQWKTVQQWADHTLYDDQRGWALEEASNDRNWKAFMLLADYGLTDAELVRVHFRICMYADWNIVEEFLERGGDATVLKQLIPKKHRTRRLKQRIRRAEAKNKRYRRLRDLEPHEWSIPFCTAVQECDWQAVLYQIRNRPSEEQIRKAREAQSQNKHQKLMLDNIHHLCNVDSDKVVDSNAIQRQRSQDISLALMAAVQKETWHVVRQLVKLGIDSSQRNSLFLEMVKQQQWGVCRVLMENGVNTELQLVAVPEFQLRHQWILLNRVMECSVGDPVVRRIMQHAMEQREGSVVWHGIRLLHNKPSVEERNTMFEIARVLEIWQVMKCLAEEKDFTGIAHRDSTMQEAIECNQWDVIEHCERHYGDINQLDASGETGLHRAAKKNDWKAVEELMRRGADQFLLDSEGKTVLQRAADAQQWDTVMLLVKFHGDLNKYCGFTPIEKLIDYRKSDIIDQSLFWGQNINGGRNRLLETPLHAVCAAGDYKTMYYLVARGMDPLALTAYRQSMLTYAAANKKCPHKMVAECIKLGVTTHQPAITDQATHMSERPWYNTVRKTWENGDISPFNYSMIHGLVALSGMLYESGACSYKELWKLYKKLNTETERVEPGDDDPVQEVRAGTVEVLQMSAEQMQRTVDLISSLEHLATTPRTLKSMCRIAISSQLRIGHRRCRDVRGKPKTENKGLHLLNSEMKDFVLFTDLTDPDFMAQQRKEDKRNQTKSFILVGGNLKSNPDTTSGVSERPK